MATQGQFIRLPGKTARCRAVGLRVWDLVLVTVKSKAYGESAEKEYCSSVALNLKPYNLQHSPIWIVTLGRSWLTEQQQDRSDPLGPCWQWQVFLACRVQGVSRGRILAGCGAIAHVRK